MEKFIIDFKKTVEELESTIAYLVSVHCLLKSKYDKGDGELHNNNEYDRECEQLTIQISNLKFHIMQLTKMDIAEYQQCDANTFQYGFYNEKSDTYFFREFNRDRFSFQYNRLKECKIELHEIWFHDQMWVEEHIDLNEYSDKEKEDFMLGYYSSFEEMKEIYGEDYKFILAECIFEQTNRLY